VPKRVLVVEDDPSIRDTLAFNLKKEGYVVTVAQDGVEALAKAREVQPDLVLLDLMLPELSGLEVCRVLRQERDVPIIMLTAKESELDKVVGLQLGADDYITKPFSLRELFARMTAVLRRTEQSPQARTEREEDRAGRLRIDRAGRRAFVDAEEVRLAPKEWELLAYLVHRPGRVFTSAHPLVTREARSLWQARARDHHRARRRLPAGRHPSGGRRGRPLIVRS
jgi:DNA-binding response OmpR family regulator